MRNKYPSDITREQFEKIRGYLEGARKTTHPRKYDLYEVFCAVLYLVKEGCTWRAMVFYVDTATDRVTSILLEHMNALV